MVTTAVCRRNWSRYTILGRSETDASDYYGVSDISPISVIIATAIQLKVLASSCSIQGLENKAFYTQKCTWIFDEMRTRRKGNIMYI